MCCFSSPFKGLYDHTAFVTKRPLSQGFATLFREAAGRLDDLQPSRGCFVLAIVLAAVVAVALAVVLAVVLAVILALVLAAVLAVVLAVVLAFVLAIVLAVGE